ncbi:MAG: hypothetical protein ABGZ17_09520 [Planctomycetaceae bacterium]
MNRLFVGNFDFEHTLAASGAGQRRVVRRVREELSFAWTAIASADDVILSPVIPDRDFVPELYAMGCPRFRLATSLKNLDSSLAVCPWGWDTAISAWCDQHALRGDCPSLDTVRELNSRDFSAGMESQRDAGLSGNNQIRSVDALARLLTVCEHVDQHWVVKARWSMAGRECLRGCGPELSSAQRNWVVTRLDRDGVVFYEPWVEKIDEVSWQFDLPVATAGPPRLLGVTQLITDCRGAHVGNRVMPAENLTEWNAVLQVVTDVADRVQSRGYRGPLGIDSMKYRHTDGSVAFRPIQDINARWTMGRLALGLSRLADPAAHVGWWHARWGDTQSPRDWWQRLSKLCGSSIRVIRTSPFEVDGRPVELGTLAVIGTDLAAVRHVENWILS